MIENLLKYLEDNRDKLYDACGRDFAKEINLIMNGVQEKVENAANFAQKKVIGIVEDAIQAGLTPIEKPSQWNSHMKLVNFSKKVKEELRKLDDAFAEANNLRAPLLESNDDEEEGASEEGASEEDDSQR